MCQNKIAVALLCDLAQWQKLNVTAFLASSVAIEFPETHSASLLSASGTRYLPFLKHPVLVYAAETEEQIKRAFDRATKRELHIGVFTAEMIQYGVSKIALIGLSRGLAELVRAIGSF